LKKEAKAFGNSAGALGMRAPYEQKFLVLFFKKELRSS
jgi:hypothetical protein